MRKVHVKTSRAPTVNVTNCSFTSVPPVLNLDTVQAVNRLAIAAQENAMAITAIASVLRGERIDAMLKVGKD
jgi:hypothetical protein